MLTGSAAMGILKSLPHVSFNRIRGTQLEIARTWGDFWFRLNVTCFKSAPSAHQISYPHQQQLAAVSTENDVAE